MSYREMDADILLLAASGLEHTAKEKLRSMTPAEWRDLREAIAKLDEWLDEAILERQQQTRVRRVKP